MNRSTMTEPELSPVKRALLEIRELRARVAELEAAAHEPVAIVGLAIRAPGGVVDMASFERLLWGGVDAIGPIPRERWNLDDWYDADRDAPGKMTTREGGFIGEVDRFDAEFFGIAPVEAASMDPQQRLALELAWEALEDAGRAPLAQAGSRTGVYLGIANADYGRSLFSAPEQIDPYYTQGNAFSVASGRIAYVLGLHGPAVSIDTACSSSLVALHLALRALRSGECDQALAGGVNLILSPEINVNFSKAGMMAADGRCKTFDARADGYVRGEGGALVVLRRLSDALADGERILAVVRGSAINQDGRSAGLTAPNGPAQEAVLRAALADAGVTPAQVGYVEAHGTGTSLGDPIEVNALGAVFAEGREGGQPLALGSVKTNIGHLEAAAGIVGLAKVVLALQRREIPPHLHLGELNPHVDWAAMPLAVPTRATPLAALQGRHLAGVSSFGFSGTNAHVLLEAAPAAAPSKACDAAPRSLALLTISARDDAALAAQAERYVAALAALPNERAALLDLCFTANAGRSHQPLRLAVQGSDAAALQAELAAWPRGEAGPALMSGRAAPSAPRVAFLFPGQGPQFLNMGRTLHEQSPVFRAAFDAAAAALDRWLPQPLAGVVFAPPGSVTPLDETQFSQPAMFAMEVSLAALWISWGITPVAVMGHSFGEYAAAHVAGALSLADAARMVAARGRLPQALPRDGAMMLVEATEADVAAAISRHGGRLAIAAINGAANTVISGERGAVEAVAATFAARGARTKPLRVSHAFHSPLMDPVLAAFEAEIADTRYSEPRLTLISNLEAKRADLALIGQAGYWRRHLREPVRFADAMRCLAAEGITHYIEMSPHPVLLGMGSEIVEGGTWLPSLREGRDDWAALFESLQSLYVQGAEVDWGAVDAGEKRQRVAAPTYPFQRRRHWIDVVPAGSAAAAPPSAERWAHLVQAMDRQSARGPLDLDARRYPHKWALLARITRAVAAQALREAGLFVRAGERHSLTAVMAQAGIAESYRHLMKRWLSGLVREGWLQEQGDDFTCAAPLPEPALPALWQEAEAELADNLPLLNYVRHCATLAGPVLRGRESPLETLFPGGSFELARALYESSATMRYINALAAAAFAASAAMTPPGRQLRVMEMGAGTGGTSSSLLAALPAGRARYRFTDVSEAFLVPARERFANLPGVSFGLFDFERDPAGQGLAAAQFDIIVAANAVHAAKDLRAALARLHALLAPGGLLVLVESTEHFEYFDITTGLIEGWQHFADDLRGEHPLLAPATWVRALGDAGFEETRTWPPQGSPAEALGQHVVVGRKAGDTVGVASMAAAAGTTPSLPLEAAAGTVATAAAQPAWRTSYDDAAPAERMDLLQDLVRRQVMSTMRLGADQTPALNDRLMNLGMDSLMAVQLRNGLARAAALPKALPSTLMFDHPTIAAIASFLQERLEATATATAYVAPAPAAASPAARPAASAATLDTAAVAAMSDDDIARLLDQRMGTS